MEDTLLASLRAKLSSEDIKVDDYCLLRFLRARKNDVEKAYAHFLEWQHFYRANDLDHILDRVPPKLELANLVLPVLATGFTKKGHPVIYQRLGELNAQALLALVNPTELAAIHCYRRRQQEEVMKVQSVKLGRNVDRLTFVIDLRFLNWHQLSANELLQTVFRLDERYYPESVEQVLVVNAPWIFPKMFKAISWMLDPSLKAKMIVCDAYGQQATLLSFIESDQLLQEYGGTNKERFPHAEPARVMQEIKQIEAAKIAKLNLTTGFVKPGAILRVPLPVTLGGEVAWFVKLNEKDILFSVEFVADSEPSVFKVHPVRCSAHEGTYDVVKPGTLYFLFDNQHSLFSSKTVRYSITLADRPDVHLPSESSNIAPLLSSAFIDRSSSSTNVEPPLYDEATLGASQVLSSSPPVDVL